MVTSYNVGNVGPTLAYIKIKSASAQGQLQSPPVLSYLPVQQMSEHATLHEG